MDLRPSDEQQQLIDACSALYAKESSPERVRAAEPLGFDAALWARLMEMGVLSMAVRESVGDSVGGWGASMLDLAFVAEQHGRFLGSAPLIETVVAARLLERIGAADELSRVLDGSRMVTVALTPAARGVARLVPAGAIADAVLVVVDGDLVTAEIGDDRVVPENSGCLPLADVTVSADTLSANTVLSGGDAVVAAMEAALDDYLVLTAQAVAAMAVRAIEIGVEYVKEREAFGQRIGAFQAVAHRLADSATAADGAMLLAREAAWSVDHEPARASELAALAFGFASETGRDATNRALHFHGGYGFMLEYDIQLYFRRVRAWARVAMSPAQAFRRAGRRHVERSGGA